MDACAPSDQPDAVGVPTFTCHRDRGSPPAGACSRGLGGLGPLMPVPGSCADDSWVWAVSCGGLPARCCAGAAVSVTVRRPRASNAVVLSAAQPRIGVATVCRHGLRALLSQGRRVRPLGAPGVRPSSCLQRLQPPYPSHSPRTSNTTAGSTVSAHPWWAGDARVIRPSLSWRISRVMIPVSGCVEQVVLVQGEHEGDPGEVWRELGVRGAGGGERGPLSRWWCGRWCGGVHAVA